MRMKVLVLALGKKRLKSEHRTFGAIFLGIAERSDTLIVGTAGGCYRVATVRRLPAQQRSDPELAKSVKGPPWRPVPGDGTEAEGERPIGAPADPVTMQG